MAHRATRKTCLVAMKMLEDLEHEIDSPPDNGPHTQSTCCKSTQCRADKRRRARGSSKLSERSLTWVPFCTERCLTLLYLAIPCRVVRFRAVLPHDAENDDESVPGLLFGVARHAAALHRSHRGGVGRVRVQGGRRRGSVRDRRLCLLRHLRRVSFFLRYLMVVMVIVTAMVLMVVRSAVHMLILYTNQVLIVYAKKGKLYLSYVATSPDLFARGARGLFEVFIVG